MNLLATLLAQASAFSRHSTDHEGEYSIWQLMLQYTGTDTGGRNCMKRQRCWRSPSRCILHAVIEGTH